MLFVLIFQFGIGFCLCGFILLSVCKSSNKYNNLYFVGTYNCLFNLYRSDFFSINEIYYLGND